MNDLNLPDFSLRYVVMDSPGRRSTIEPTEKGIELEATPLRSVVV